jgi:hypothetical protein
LREIERRTDLLPAHLAAVIRSYLEMMRQYAREIKLYEEMHPGASEAATSSPRSES